MKNIVTAALILAAVSGTVSADVVLDGVKDGDTYLNSETVSWYQGHQTHNSIYGDFNNQLGSTTISYGESGGHFYLFVEAPLYAKNMIWEDRNWGGVINNTDENAGLTEEDVHQYRVHHETHHNPYTMNLDFGGATGSEKFIFVDGNGDEAFKADIDGNVDNSFGLIAAMDSADYLIDNGFATESLSLNRNRTMSYEFKFTLNATENEAILELIRNGIELHLSPERGLPVPTPGSLALLGLGGMGMIRRRR